MFLINADQTPSPYISVGRATMAKQGSKYVAIKGLSNKRNITLTLLVNKFLPLQNIYCGKPVVRQPHDFHFPEGFCVTQNLRHWSNE